MIRIDAKRDALIVVDVQNDFCSGGALAVPDGDAVVTPINRLAALFDHVILTQDWHPADHASFASQHAGAAPFTRIETAHGPQTLWPDHCVQGARGAALREGLETGRATAIVRKGWRRAVDSYSAFFENDRATPTGLAGLLKERGIARVFLVGLATDFCVSFSALDARRAGFEAAVVVDACRAIDLDGSLEAARTAWEQAGVAVAQSGEISGGG